MGKWQSRIKVWRLKEDEVKEKYESTLKNASMNADGDANKKWENMKEIMINAAEEACGKTKGPPRHQETWWWNEEVESFVDRKRECYQEWYKAKERKKNEDKATRDGTPVVDGVTVSEINELKAIYDKAKNEAKKAVASKERRSEEFGRMVDSEEGRQNLFKIA